MRTWKCEYCERENQRDLLDCRKCGAPRPEGLKAQPVMLGDLAYYSSGSTASSYVEQT